MRQAYRDGEPDDAKIEPEPTSAGRSHRRAAATTDVGVGSVDALDRVGSRSRDEPALDAE